jgi:hypothetical protein
VTAAAAKCATQIICWCFKLAAAARVAANVAEWC